MNVGAQTYDNACRPQIVWFYKTANLKVNSNCDLLPSSVQLQLELSRPAPFFGPNGIFALKVTGDPDATVALVGVDKGVHALNNNHRLTQKKAFFFYFFLLHNIRYGI